MVQSWFGLDLCGTAMAGAGDILTLDEHSVLVLVNVRQRNRFRLVTVAAWVWISLLVASATPFACAAGWWWPFELLSHFRVHYIWLLTPLTAGLFVAKRYRVALVTGCCLIWNLVLVAPDFWGSSALVDSSVHLRVMSANVHTSNRDYERFLQTVRAADPDVLLVMEIDERWLQAMEELRDDYPHGTSAPRADNFGIGLFSKLPVEAPQVKYVGSAGVPSIQGCLKVGDEKVNIVGTHPLPPMGRNSALRNEQLSAIADLAAGINGPVIVAGDLNTTPWSPFFRKLLKRSGTRDSRRGFGVQPTWPSHWGSAGIPIDHVLVSDEIHVKDRHVGPAFGSDHRAVVVDLIIAR
jgi:endonuclease/exonuclease/phosphatase (EEP) superfamily protein YafD